MNFIRLSREGWLLYCGVLLLLLGIALLFLIGVENYNGTRTYEGIAFPTFFVMATIYAPIFEELVFRGNFAKKSLLRLLALIGMPVFLVLTQVDWLDWSLLFVFYTTYFISKHYPDNRVLLKLSFLINAILFGSIHYKMSDFIAFDTAFYVLFQIGLGLILTWIMLNYGLLRSMLFHSFYNLILVVPLILYVQFPEEKLRYFENEYVQIEWRKVPAMNNLVAAYKASDSLISVTNFEGAVLYNVLKTDSVSQRKIRSSEPWSKFNFKIVLKDTTNNVKIEDEAMRFLENEMLEMLENDDD